MSDLSLVELDAEHGELLPERETLAVIQVNIGGAAAIGIKDSASNSQSNTLAINSGNTIASGNTVGSYDGNAVGSYDGDLDHFGF